MFGFTNLDIFSGGRTSHTSGIPVRSNGPRGVIWSGGNVSQHFPLVNSITPQKLGKTLFLCHRDLMKSGISGKVCAIEGFDYTFAETDTDTVTYDGILPWNTNL